jgi:hypothetical protein
MPKHTLRDGVLNSVLPVVIVLVAGLVRWANLGTDGTLDIGEPRLSAPIGGM